MGSILIRMRGDARTGAKSIVVEYESDPDQTRTEHEQRHRAIVEQLVRDGVIDRDQVTRVVFEERSHQNAAGEAAAEGQGG